MREQLARCIGGAESNPRQACLLLAVRSRAYLFAGSKEEEIAVNDLASRLRTHPEGDLSLAAGGVALAIGSILAFDRMGGSWAAFPLLLVLAIPCAILFVLALAPGSGGAQIGTRPDGRLAPWQTAFLLFGLGLLAASIVQLTEVLGKDDPGTGTATWIFWPATGIVQAGGGSSSSATTARLATPRRLRRLD